MKNKIKTIIEGILSVGDYDELENIATDIAKELKEEMRLAWLHGAVRSPNRMKHLNNFEDYYFNKYEKYCKCFRSVAIFNGKGPDKRTCKSCKKPMLDEK